MKPLSWLAWLLGIAWRYQHILVDHPMTQFLYSDMGTYRDSALHLLDPRYAPRITDTIYPPGTGFFYALLHRVDPTWRSAEWVMFALACLAPLLLAAIARLLFDARVACLALIFASLYFPWIDYFAFMLSEGPFIIAVLSAVLLGVLAFRARGRQSGDVLAVACGALFALAASVKMVALAWAIVLVLVFAWWQWRQRVAGLLRLALWCTLGTCVLLVPLGERCTRLNEGRFCMIANNGPMNILLGHEPDVRTIVWTDPVRNTSYYFGSPPDGQRNFDRVLTLGFGVYDGPANLRWAVALAKANPILFFERSADQLFNLFGSEPWPATSTPEWRRRGILYQQLFLIFILIPALFHLARQGRELLLLRVSAAPEIILSIPLVSLMAVCFLTAGEPRYRIPLDGFTMILAAVEILRWFGVHAERARL